VGVFALAHPRSYRLGEQKLNELPVILLVEDDQGIQGIVEDTLSEGGFEVVIAASGEEAATLLSAPTAPTE
jgi:CheY-like chemotaxis protein